ncbi:hypothetical protein AAKU55_000546 [Oxalobacteraceae bacterium GrIS 1.11]
MSKYNQQYYFIRSADNDSNPDLTPDTNTEDRRFSFEKQPMGSPPLVFFNGAKEYQQKMGIPSVKIPPEILFDGTNMLVPSRIRKILLKLDIPHLHMHPAIYIHDDGKWYEDYWYMAFSERFDCWDRKTSNYEQDDPPIRLGGFELYQIYTYSLNDELLDAIPLEQRLLFKIGETLDAFIVCHESLSRLFYTNDQSGTKLTLIPDY